MISYPKIPPKECLWLPKDDSDFLYKEELQQQKPSDVFETIFGCPLAKYQKVKRQETVDICTKLQPELMSEIYSYLEVGDLLRLSTTSKSIPNGIQYHHVLRIAMMSKEVAAKIACDRILHLVSRGDIFTPSVMRLLRLVNGKRCELCLGTASRVSARFGVFCCWKPCIGGQGGASGAVVRVKRNRTTKWRRFVLPRDVFLEQRKEKATETITHNQFRLAMYEAPSSVLVWRKRFRDADTGEWCGPILSSVEVANERPYQLYGIQKACEEAHKKDWYNTPAGRKNKKSELLRACLLVQKEGKQNGLGVGQRKRKRRGRS